MVVSPDLLAAWDAATIAHPGATAPYDVAHMVDVAALLPAVGGTQYFNYNNQFLQPMVAAQAHPAALAHELAAAHTALQRLVAESGFQIGCAPPRCG